MTTRYSRRIGTRRLAAITLFAIALPMFGHAVAGNADEGCNGVFSGKTPRDPITKTADKSEVEIGDTVTFTVSWHSTGADTANVRDCYRIDDGSNSALNTLVESMNAVKIVDNVGPKGSAQSTTFTVTVPDDDTLVGHDLVDRAKIKHGSRESRSGFVSVAIVGHLEVVVNPTPTPTPTEPTEVLREFIKKPRARVLGTHLARTGPDTTFALFGGIAFVLMGMALLLLAPQPARRREGRPTK